MRVSVVKVRPVRMRVHYGLVLMSMRVPGRRRQSWMPVIVMLIIMPVRVFVHNDLMFVYVSMALQAEQADASDEEQCRAQVNETERFPEEEHGEDNAEEWGTGEDDLGTGGAECLRRGDVEHDADAVGPDADEHSRQDRERSHRERGEHESDGKVRRAGREPLPKRALTGSDAVDEGRQVVVQPPAQAREKDEAAGRQPASATGQGQETRSGEHASRSGPAPNSEVVAEEEDAQQCGCRNLEVQPERDGGSSREAKAEKEQHGPADAASDNRAEQPETVRTIAAARQAETSCPHRRGSDPDCRAQVEQAGELERREPGKKQLARGRRRPEERRCQNGESYRTLLHPLEPNTTDVPRLVRMSPIG